MIVYGHDQNSLLIIVLSGTIVLVLFPIILIFPI